jgi:hypothetical protein
MTGLLLALAGLTCGDGGPGTGAATATVAFSRWPTDFRAFCAHADQARSRGADLAKLYENRSVTWRLRFKGFPTSWRGPGNPNLCLFFDIENPLATDRHVCFWARRHDDWRDIRPGAFVTIRGRVEAAGTFTRHGDGRKCVLVEVGEVVPVAAAPETGRPPTRQRRPRP